MRELLLVDDHPLFRAGLAQVIAVRYPQARILAAASAEEGFTRLRECSALDLVIVDVVLPGSDGFAALAEYSSERPEVPRMLMSGVDDPGFALRARRAGAAGFFPKTLDAQAILRGLEAVLAGGDFFPHLRSSSAAQRGASAPPKLTPREQEVLVLLAQGLTNREIASFLRITERTAKAHVTALMQALGGENRTHALILAQAAGLVPLTR